MENTKGNVVNENKKDIETISGSPRATSGTIVNNFRTGYEVRIVWNVNSQNVANNSSNVTVKVQFVSTGSSYNINSSATKNGSLTINGTKYSFTFSASLSGGQTKTVFTKTVDIPHNSDGTKSCSMSTTLGINVTLSGTYWGDVSASGTASFNAIPRTSSFSLNTTSGTIGSTQFVVNINRASNDFTHKVYYRFGSINWLGSSNATTSFSFTPSLSDCSQIPSATSGVGTIVVETWNGGTHIGTASQNITLYVPDSVKPSFSSLGSELIEAGASASYGYVKGKSKCKLSVNGATGNQGSSINGYYISGGGFSSNQWEFTTGALTTAGNITFSAYVTDSRGRRSDTKTVTINVQDYTSPTIDLAMGYRCDSEGIPDENGTYIKVKFEHSIADNIPGNDWTNRVHYKSASSSTWIDAGNYASARGRVIGNGDISTNSTYNVRYTLSDKFETVTKIFDVAPSFVTLDFKRGGKGIAIGKISEVDNLFEVAMNTKLSGNSNCVTGLNNTASTRVSNLNELWKSGFYDGEGMANAPFSGWNWVINCAHTNNKADYKYGMQIASQNGSNNFAMRTTNVNGAGNWCTLYHSGSPINLPSNGGSWLNGATNGNIRGSKQSTGSYHPIISQTTSSNHKISLGGLGDSFGFYLYDAGRTANGYDKEFTFNLGNKNLYTSCRTIHNEWIYCEGNYGLYFPSHNGGWFMSDSTWVRSYADKNIYTGGTVQSWTQRTRYLKAIDSSHNVDLEFDSGTGYLNVYSGSGAGIIIGRPWSGSSGTEPALYNNKGNGWGFIGNSGTAFYRVYGLGGSVSDRNKKYHITKADSEEQYENIKNLNIYNYRTISTSDSTSTELAEKHLTHTNFKDMDGNYISTSVVVDGIEYKELEEGLSQDEIKELRIEEIIEKNPHFSEVKRQDLMLGAMVDELPTEVTFYDNEGGDGKAVDMYSYTTMIAGASKHLISKVENLEKENELKDRKIDELESRLEKMEELLNGIINKG